MPEGKVFGYKPVMHQNIGILFSDPPDAFWSIVYETLSVPESALFPMQTIADKETLKPYFNAGMLIVRPEKGILQHWAVHYPELYKNPDLVRMSNEDLKKRIFLHQAALTGSILKTVPKDEMVEISDRYNYPLFFQDMFDSEVIFNSIEEAVTIRYDLYFRKPDPQWAQKLKGDKEKIKWLKKRLPGPEKEGPE